MRRLLRAFFLFFPLAALAGCALGRGALGPEFRPPSTSGLVENVPFYPQEDYQCGPAALAGVLNFHGLGVTPDEVAAAVFRKNISSTVTLDMVLYPRQKGFSSRWYNGSLPDLERAVDEGLPLIVMVDNGWGRVSLNHFLIVIGYGPRGVIAHSGRTRAKLIQWDRFLAGWARARRWTLCITPRPKQETGPDQEKR